MAIKKAMDNMIKYLDIFWQKAWLTETKQAKNRLDMGWENNYAILENFVFKYFLLCYITKQYDYVNEILSGLDIYGGVIPRVRVYGYAGDLQKEDPTNLWDKRLDNLDRECWMRLDMGIGQSTCLLGLNLIGIVLHNGYVFVKARTLANKLAKSIAYNKFRVQYNGKTVPQGNYLFLYPCNNLLEALCISIIAQNKMPFPYNLIASYSVRNCMPWDDPKHRSILLWWLKEVKPNEFSRYFDKWISKRANDVEECKARMDGIHDVQDPDWLQSRLNYHLQEAIRRS